MDSKFTFGALVLALAGATSAQVQFESRHALIEPKTADFVTLGDLDGDGAPDAFGRRSSTAFVSRNDGTGRFRQSAGALPPVALARGRLQLVDVDLDLDLDLVSPESVWLNDGLGSFIQQTTLFAGIGDRMDVAFGDVDGDGDLDLAIGTGGPFLTVTGRTRLLRNDAGTYVDATAQLPMDEPETRSVAFGDVDGDGDLDLVLANGVPFFGAATEANDLYLNDGAGNFTDASANLPNDLDESRALALFDVDGDLDLDLFVGNLGQDRLYLNDGAGVFVEDSLALPALTGLSDVVAVGDLNADGAPDLALETQWLANDGSGTFSFVRELGEPGDGLRSVALGDVDGDADLDVYLASSGPLSRLYLNDGVGVLVEVSSPQASDTVRARRVALVDVDADDDLDAILVGDVSIDGSSSLRLLTNDGSSVLSLASRNLVEVPAEIVAVAVGDVDGDGDPDLLAGSRKANARLLLNEVGGGFVEAPGQVPAGGDWALALALADVEGDGDLDAFLARGFFSFPPGPPNALWLNDGAGTFTDASAQLPLDADNAQAVGFGDIDGDGDPDVLVGNVFGPARLYRNDGTGSFSDASSSIPSVPSLFGDDLEFGDLDGDGDLDAFLTGQAGPPNASRLLWNDGTGTFDDAPTSSVFDAVIGLEVALADLDEDGDLDVFLGGGPATLFENQGAMQFIDVSERAPLLEFVSGFAVGDLDADGDVDVVTSLAGPDRVLYGLARHLAWDNYPRVGFPLNLLLDGAPNGAWVLACSPGTGDLFVPPFGTLLLDATVLSILDAGPLDADGHASYGTLVPDDAALAGQSFYWQAGVGVPFRFTNRERTVLADL